jgi:hypothetical protein
MASKDLGHSVQRDCLSTTAEVTAAGDDGVAPQATTPASTDSTSRRQSVTKNKSDHYGSMIDRETVTSEEVYTTAASQDSNESVSQGRWKTFVSRHRSKASLIVQAFIWLVFTA